MHSRIFAVGKYGDVVARPCARTAESLGWQMIRPEIHHQKRKWGEGVYLDKGVVAGLFADDLHGSSTKGARFAKTDELKEEKSVRTAHDCGLDEAKVGFFGDSAALKKRATAIFV